MRLDLLQPSPYVMLTSASFPFFDLYTSSVLRSMSFALTNLTNYLSAGVLIRLQLSIWTTHRQLRTRGLLYASLCYHIYLFVILACMSLEIIQKQYLALLIWTNARRLSSWACRLSPILAFLGFFRKSRSKINDSDPSRVRAKLATSITPHRNLPSCHPTNLSQIPLKLMLRTNHVKFLQRYQPFSNMLLVDTDAV